MNTLETALLAYLGGNSKSAGIEPVSSRERLETMHLSERYNECNLQLNSILKEIRTTDSISIEEIAEQATIIARKEIPGMQELTYLKIGNWCAYCLK